MKYTESKAIELQKKYGLKKSVITVWKSRGTIPKRYESSDYTAPTIVNRVELNRVRKLIQSKKLNKNALRELLNDINSLYDYVDKSVRFTKENYIIIKKRVVEINNLIKRLDAFPTVNEQSFRLLLEILDCREIVILHTFGKRWLDIKHGKIKYISQDEYDEFKKQARLWVLEHSI